MKWALPKIYKQIFPPLVAMLILTGLVAATVNQVTETWENEIRKLNSYVNQTLFFNNVRLSLARIDKIKQSSPSKAKIGWESLKYQVKIFVSQPDSIPEMAAIYAFLSTDENIDEIETVFNTPSLQLQPSEIQNKLYILQQYSSLVTQGVTISLLALGVILMVVTTLDLGRLFTSLEESRDLNIRLQEEERHRIAQDLHDGVIQELIDLKRSYAPEKVDALVNSIRRICNNLKPQMLEDIGFAAALESLADDLRQQGTMTVSLSYEDSEIQSLPKDTELPLFRVIQEIMNNIKRHAQAERIRISLVYDPSDNPFFRVYILDDGVGFDVRTVKKGLGLVGMRERIARLGGHLDIISVPGQGSRFQIFIPVKKT